MVDNIRIRAAWIAPAFVGACLWALCVFVTPAAALNQIPDPDPKPGSYGIEATKMQEPPKRGATITTPGNGASFSGSSSPITVNGICPTGLLVEIYNNDVMVGSVMCKNGSFSIRVSLFVGVNELSAIVYDDIGQAGPRSRIVEVRYSNSNFEAFGELVTLTSSYGRRSAAVGAGVRWPLQLSGGTGPYAFSIDWGDNSKPVLKSQELPGVVTIAHAYKNAGIYQVHVTVTDVNGASAFLQLIAVSNGKVDPAANKDTEGEGATTTRTEVLWIPAAVGLVLLLPAFWLGRRSQLVSLRNKMLKERDSYEADK